ncbi:fimbrial protein [Photorhabdus temperata]|uniref:fimbrial protein n=1 Tax=Photorhabdus temperata TaxID=574560 RepID=UPI000389FF65|nr:fimbrial protein [Photorhabdus temperata]EQC00520.1 major fimbrial subunit precursor [Photorhabdus temperata subsp. temperata M1021]
MRKNFIWASLIIVLGIFTSFNALSYDGVIKFRGTIINNGCTISSSGKDQTVNFGKISKSALGSTPGTVAITKSFSIELTSCPGSTVDIEFIGIKDAHNPTLYSTGVSGAGILLAKNDGTKIDANTKIPDYAITGGNASIALIAKLQSTNTTIGNGTISSDVNFTLIYP